MGREHRAPDAPQALIGRDVEQAAIDALVAAAHSGRSGSLVIRGGPGMGKTALLEHARVVAADALVLGVGGLESEATFAFAGLHRLLLPVLHRLDRLPAPQRSALRAAFGFAEGADGSRFLVGMGLLTVLGEVAADRPLVLAVDDAHWLDPETVGALAFAARRLAADRVAVLCAVREPSARAAVLADLDGLTLDGLAGPDAEALLERSAGRRLTGAATRRIVDEAQGCPLALIEIAQGLSAEQLAGGAPLPDFLPLGPRMEGHYLERVRTLPADTQRLLLVLAAGAGEDPSAVWAVMGELGVPPEAVDAAVDAGLVDAADRSRFRHPLVRSAVYAGARAADCRRVHAAFAGVTDERAHGERHAWHLAAAAAGPDETVAAALERVAHAAGRRGGHQAASTLFERAGQLSPSRADAGRRALDAALAASHAGATSAATALLTAVRAQTTDPHLLARARWLQGSLEVVQFRAGAGSATLCDAATALATFDVHAANRARLDAVDAFLAGGRGADGVTALAVGATALAGVTSSSGLVGRFLRAYGALFTEPIDVAAPHMRAALDAYLAPDVDAAELARSAHLAIVLAEELWDPAALSAVVRALEPVVHQQGMLVALIGVRTAAATLAIRAGRFADAASAYERGIDAIEMAGGSAQRARRLDVLLRAWSGTPGTAAAATELVAEAHAAGSGVSADRGRFALAVYELGAGNYRAALDAADDVAAGPLSWRSHALPIVIEAASRLGERSRAESALTALHRRARASGTAWARAASLRSEALLADGDAPDGLYREALDLLHGPEVRLERARTHLLYGEWLRRAKRRLDARAQLTDAHEMFRAFGAIGFAERAHRELRATGGRARARTVDNGTTLTPQERVVAQLAASGATNQEIATQLFLSASTVDYHLGKVYRKLGLRSRRELRGVFRD